MLERWRALDDGDEAQRAVDSETASAPPPLIWQRVAARFYSWR
ncbi:MAG: hypothetical protein R2710_12945 [Acidimicrobiales bacterium]